jgi:twitching motility protein PilU
VFCIRDLVDCLYDRIAEAAEPHQGLILVTGATNSTKSKIARGLAWRMLKKIIEDPKAQDRGPHLVTFEDPIEQFFWKAEHPATGDPDAAPAIDYTPRQRQKDCAELKQGLDDALRQTPAVFYIGEIRDSEEMCQAVEFGGTGHLAIATAHAGNLIEGVGKLLKAVKAANSGVRAIYASGSGKCSPSMRSS